MTAFRQVVEQSTQKARGRKVLGSGHLFKNEAHNDLLIHAQKKTSKKKNNKIAGTNKSWIADFGLE